MNMFIIQAGLVNLDGEWHLKEVIENFPLLEKRMAEQEPYWTPGRVVEFIFSCGQWWCHAAVLRVNGSSPFSIRA